MIVTGGDEIWAKVEYNGLSGYVMAVYLQNSAGGGAPAGSPTQSPGTTEIQAQETARPEPMPAQASGGAALTPVEKQTFALIAPEEGKSLLTLWKECGETSNPEADMLRGEQVEVLMRGETWCQVVYMNLTGYCLTGQITFVGE